VNTGDPYPAEGSVNVAFDTKGFVVLANLITLGKVGIKVMFAVEFADGGDLTVEGETNQETVVEGFFVGNRERPWKSQTDRTSIGIGSFGVKGVILATTEHLALGSQLHVDFSSTD